MGEKGRVWHRWSIACLVGMAILAGCARPAAPAAGDVTSVPGTGASGAEKRIVYAVPNPPDIRPTASLGPRQTVLPLIGAGLSAADGGGGRVPLLAEAIPSLDNGLWTVAEDGTMVTTFHLRPNARWHDGTPITADDFVLSLQVGREGRVPALRSAAYAAIADVSAPDAQTLVVDWSESYNAADALFDWTQSYGAPLPRHVLADQYAADPGGFLDLS